MAIRRMSEAEFAAVEILLGIARPFSKEKIAYARLVLVDGLSVGEVAKLHGTTRQNFSTVVSKLDNCLTLYKEAKAIEIEHSPPAPTKKYKKTKE
jgi:predicted DNA-binding protein YlxM (UPF0122 family)